MNKFRGCASAARCAALTGIFLFGAEFFQSAAKDCPPSSAPAAKQSLASNYKNSDSLVEEFSFLIEDFKMNHQTQNNNLNIKIRYCYQTGITNSEYPDFRPILDDIKNFLSNYPNKTDYWEIVNKNLTQMVLKKYSALSSVTSEIQVSPSSLVPYSRSSVTTRSQSKIKKPAVEKIKRKG